jgi:hypothetical protein
VPPCCTSAERERERDVNEQPHPHREKHAKGRLHPMSQPIVPAPTNRLAGGAVVELEPEHVAKAACCTHKPQPVAVASAKRDRTDIIAAFAILAFVFALLALRQSNARLIRKPLPRELLPSTLMTEASIKRLRSVEPRWRETIDA